MLTSNLTSQSVFSKQINPYSIQPYFRVVYLFRKTRVDLSNCFLIYLDFLVRSHQFVVFYLFFLKIKEKSHKVVSRVARNYLIFSILLIKLEIMSDLDFKCYSK